MELLTILILFFQNKVDMERPGTNVECSLDWGK